MEEQNLTAEQKKFLNECENEFKDRYTEKDSEFIKTKNMKKKDPPILDPWYSRNTRNDHRRDRRYSDKRYRHRYHGPYK
ncbi:hypothetical protein WH47_07926 [Habropoda laboriosa]|uniref:RNMT-activating mini protein n=1 Tax=Habropoda laboriosa TaxID=597456 RepID=A0A0L7RI68_9HYME|nr:hypothetical protein WH47_07926 [Habropoda laboriosa]